MHLYNVHTPDTIRPCPMWWTLQIFNEMSIDRYKVVFINSSSFSNQFSRNLFRNRTHVVSFILFTIHSVNLEIMFITLDTIILLRDLSRNITIRSRTSERGVLDINLFLLFSFWDSNMNSDASYRERRWRTVLYCVMVCVSDKAFAKKIIIK